MKRIIALFFTLLLCMGALSALADDLYDVKPTYTRKLRGNRDTAQEWMQTAENRALIASTMQIDMILGRNDPNQVTMLVEDVFVGMSANSVIMFFSYEAALNRIVYIQYVPEYDLLSYGYIPNQGTDRIAARSLIQNRLEQYSDVWYEIPVIDMITQMSYVVSQ